MNEDRKVICEVKDKVADLLYRANESKKFSMGDVDFLYKATKTIKNACEIEQMMGDDGYSSANRGKHYVRGHYSRDGGMGGYSDRRDGRGRYSRADGRSEMMGHLEAALDSATEQDREDIRRFMRKLEDA